MLRQLEGRYWQHGGHINQEGAARSGWLTLIIKRSDKLFHSVNEHQEFSGFGHRGGSKGRSEWERTIACEHGSCSAMKVKMCGVMDLFYSVCIVRKVIGKFELESVANLAPKLRWEGMGKGVALFSGSEVVFSDREHCDGNKISVILS